MDPRLHALFEAAETIVLGKQHAIQLAVCCLLARGHLLIEDMPGVGKTTLAHTLAHLLGLKYQRVQFTADLLPGDIIGASVFDPTQQRFSFHPGPVFSQVLLADEINRASPKTQSALLEAMEERQASIEGRTLPLPQPFFVIATQNPLSQIGTFPLPESQLDRFLMCISLGYPDHRAERALLQGEERRRVLEHTPPCLQPDDLVALQNAAATVFVSGALLDYIQTLLEFSRYSGEYLSGLSPRAGLGVLAAARAWAFLQGRAAVLPDDVQAVLAPSVAHRLQRSRGGSREALAVVAPLLELNVP